MTMQRWTWRSAAGLLAALTLGLAPWAAARAELRVVACEPEWAALTTELAGALVRDPRNGGGVERAAERLLALAEAPPEGTEER